MSRLKTLLSNLPPLEIPAPPTILLNFTLFPKLAPEIRDMIWKYVVCEPRTVKLFVIEKHAGGQAETMQVAGQTRHPGIVHVCRESRAVGLKSYEECIALESGQYGVPAGSKTVFVNFSVDRFAFEMPLHRFAYWSDFNFKQGIIKRIQHIEILKPKNDIYDPMFYRILWLHLDVAKVVRFTIFDWHSKHPNPSVYEAKACLDSILTYRRCAQCRIIMPKPLPKLEFYWRTMGDKDIVLCPCAPSEDPLRGRKKLKLCIDACSSEREG